MTHIYKILTHSAWAKAEAVGAFTGAEIDIRDGYIHLSTAEQAAETARLHFRGRDDLVLVGFVAEAFGDRLKWEPSRGGQLFPHVYGVLPTSAAVSITPAPLGADGAPQIPRPRAVSVQDFASRALRALDPEDAHKAAILGLKLGLGPRDPEPDDPILATTLVGLKLPNCVGLAAGFDKNAEVPAAMLRAGFGFVECGTVTPVAQAGNPRPRLFRLSEDRAVINRMGFNNEGVERFARRLASRGAGIVGANIAANKDAGDRIADYVTGLRRVAGLCDYVTVNISSPNTPGLRALQTRAALDELLGRLAEARLGLAVRPPVFLKVAPDLEPEEPGEIVAAVRRHGVDGVIVSNTTVDRSPLKSAHAGESGGLSGRPLLEKSTAMLRAFREADPELPLIGVGGIASGADAYARIRAGADAVQLYSALVFEGPGLVTRIKRDLAALLRADGFASVAEARG